MNVRVKLFAAARQLAGNDTIDVELPPPATVAALRSAITERYPQLAGLLRQAMIAVDTEYAGNDVVLSADSEVACIPPVSGG